MLRVNLVALIAFVFFRSSSTDDALILLRSMAGMNANAHLSVQPLSLMVFLFLPVVWFLPNTQQILAESGSGIDSAAERRGLHWKPSPTWALAMALAFFLSIIATWAPDPRFFTFSFNQGRETCNEDFITKFARARLRLGSSRSPVFAVLRRPESHAHGPLSQQPDERTRGSLVCPWNECCALGVGDPRRRRRDLPAPDLHRSRSAFKN